MSHQNKYNAYVYPNELLENVCEYIIATCKTDHEQNDVVKHFQNLLILGEQCQLLWMHIMKDASFEQLTKQAIDIMIAKLRNMFPQDECGQIVGRINNALDIRHYRANMLTINTSDEIEKTLDLINYAHRAMNYIVGVALLSMIDEHTQNGE